MTDFPALKLRSLVNFPAQALGRNGIGIAKEDGVFYVDIDYSEYVPVSSIPGGDVPNLYTLLWNNATGVYMLAPITLVGQLYVQGATVVVTTTPYEVLQNDGAVIVKLAVPAPTAINLPFASAKNGPVHISDGALNAAANNITITPAAGETINGLASWKLAGNGAGITLYPVAGVGWYS